MVIRKNKVQRTLAQIQVVVVRGLLLLVLALALARIIEAALATFPQ